MSHILEFGSIIFKGYSVYQRSVIQLEYTVWCCSKLGGLTEVGKTL